MKDLLTPILVIIGIGMAILFMGVAAAQMPPALFASPLGSPPSSPEPFVFTNFVNQSGQLRARFPLPHGATEWTVTYWARQQWKPPVTSGDGRLQYGDASPTAFYTFDPCRQNLPAFFESAGTGPRVFTNVLPAARDTASDPGSAGVFSNGVFYVTLDVDGAAALTVAADTAAVTNRAARNFRGSPGKRDVSIDCAPSAAWTLKVAERPVVRFFSLTPQRFSNDGSYFTQDGWRFTNEYVFCAHRVRLDGAGHRARTDMVHAGTEAVSDYESRNFETPPAVDVTTNTVFEVRTFGSVFPPASNTVWNVWNPRVHPRWLGDGSIMAIRDGDLRAMGRLGVKLWHEPD